MTKISFDHAMSGNEGILSRGLRQGAKCLEELIIAGVVCLDSTGTTHSSPVSNSCMAAAQETYVN